MRVMKVNPAGLVLAFFSFAAACPLAAETYHWTGSKDGFWTNANNWAEGAVPGRSYNASGEKAGAVGDIAVFDGARLAGVQATTIDFNGVYSISNLLTTGSARFTYGTSAEQYVPIEPNGVFSAAETAETPAAAIVARLLLGVELMTPTGSYETMTVRNNAADEFVLGEWGYSTYAADRGKGSEPYVRFEGAGPIRLSGKYGGVIGSMRTLLAMTGRLTFDAVTKVRTISIPALEGVSSPQQIEITANGSLEPYGCYDYLAVRRATVVSGEGPFKFGVGEPSGLGVSCINDIFAPLTFLGRVENSFIGTPPDDYAVRLFVNNGDGTLTFAGDCRLQGLVQATIASSPTFSAGTLGMRGTFGDLGDVDFLFSSATLRYTGAGETTDRTVTLTNRNNGTAGKVTFEQAGAGPFTMAGAVALADGMTAGTLVLKGASSAPAATFAGNIDAGVALAKEGTGFWTFAPQNDFTGAVTVSGGTLAFSKSLRLASLTAASGTTRIRVEAGKTLTVDALSVASGKTLDFLLMDAAASVTFPNETAGTTLANVTLNGHPVRLDDSGTLQAVTDGDNVWKTSVSGSWDDAANWIGETAPDPTRTTYIDAPGDADYTVVLGGETFRETTLTNLVINNICDGTATLRVTNATVTAEGHTTAESVLRIGAGGRLDVVDATFRVRDMGNALGVNSNRSSVEMDGGEITARGNSAFITRGVDASLRKDGQTSNLNSFFTFGTGSLSFSDDAVFKSEREGNLAIFYKFMPTRAGETVDVSFRDRARLDLNGATAPVWSFSLAGNGGRATVLVDSGYENLVTGLGNQNRIGEGTGVGEYLLRRGAVETGTWDLLHIGTSGTDTQTSATLFATGRVEVAQGASLTAHCAMYLSNSFGGVAVGNAAALTGARGTSFVHGELRVAGTFTQVQGNFLVAEGPDADGDVFQDGGTVSIVDDPNKESDNTRGEVAIGAFGGYGRYTLTAGAFSTGHNVYLGGAMTNDLFRWHANGDVLQQYHDARGVLSVSGGSFTTAKRLILGRDGTGVLALSGAGVVSAESIVVSNTVGQAASEIRFTADAERRCGTIAPATKLVFLPGARVVVDVTAEAAKESPRRLRVWSLDTAPEGLANVTFELVGAEGLRTENRLALSDDGRTLTWNVSRGSVLIVR